MWLVSLSSLKYAPYWILFVFAPTLRSFVICGFTVFLCFVLSVPLQSGSEQFSGSYILTGVQNPYSRTTFILEKPIAKVLSLKQWFAIGHSWNPTSRGLGFYSCSFSCYFTTASFLSRVHVGNYEGGIAFPKTPVEKVTLSIFMTWLVFLSRLH